MAYTPLAEDTTPEIEVMRLTIMRDAGMSKRMAIASTHTKRMQQLSLGGFKRREQDAEVIRQKFAKALLGMTPNFFIWSEPDVWAASDPFDLAIRLHNILTRLGVDYFVTGGVAVSCHGEPRATVDLDVVISIERQDLDILEAILTQEGFYVPHLNLEEVKAGKNRTLCITHQQECTNADLIIPTCEPLSLLQIERRVFVDPPGVYVCSAEDVILNKLKWSAKSLSEKQWRDVQTVLRIQGDRLDLSYLHHWAVQLGESERLNQALSEAGIF